MQSPFRFYADTSMIKKKEDLKERIEPVSLNSLKSYLASVLRLCAKPVPDGSLLQNKLVFLIIGH